MNERTFTNGALVLEGGSLRGLFTCGVLDTFQDNDINLSYVNGVSAGAMCGMSYVSNQRGRTKRVNIEFLHDKKYISFRKMFKYRTIFDFDYLFDVISVDYIPFHWDDMYASPQRFEVIATDCITAKPAYFDKDTCPEFDKACIASASMPIMSKPQKVSGRLYLDGGIAFPFGYDRALELGYKKIIIVMTRERGFIKKQMPSLLLKGYDRYFKPLPQFLKACKTRAERYNKLMEIVDKAEDEGKILTIRPEHAVDIARIEQDENKLEALYEHGIEVAKANLERVKKYLDIV